MAQFAFTRANHYQSPLGRAPSAPTLRTHLLTLVRLAIAVVVCLGCMWLTIGAAQAALLAYFAQEQQIAHAMDLPPPDDSAQARDMTSLLTVAVGGTQSYRNVAITISDLRVVTRLGVVGAPSGQAIAIVTITLHNLDPARAQWFNTGDYVLRAPGGALHHAIFADLDDPLGAGQIAPNGAVAGEIAFLVAYPQDTNANDPQILYAPSAAGGSVLSWSVPVGAYIP